VLIERAELAPALEANCSQSPSELKIDSPTTVSSMQHRFAE